MLGDSVIKRNSFSTLRNCEDVGLGKHNNGLNEKGGDHRMARIMIGRIWTDREGENPIIPMRRASLC